jgi:hypothetical protein
VARRHRPLSPTADLVATCGDDALQQSNDYRHLQPTGWPEQQIHMFFQDFFRLSKF